jgi:hypothetical protein
MAAGKDEEATEGQGVGLRGSEREKEGANNGARPCLWKILSTWSVFLSFCLH